MPRGGPDGGIDSSLAYASQITDLAYISNVLWGFSPIDAQGRIIHLDTFNNGLAGWAPVTTGAGAAPSITSGFSGEVYSPPNGVKFSPGVVANDISMLIRQYYLGQTFHLGLEAGFSFKDTVPQWTFVIDYKPIGRTAYTAQLYYNRSVNMWRLLTGSGAGTGYDLGVQMNIASTNLRLMQVKVVADWETGKYKRVYIGDQVIDVSNVTMYLSTLTVEGYLAEVVRTLSYGAGSTYGVLGYALLTKDEPI